MANRLKELLAEATRRRVFRTAGVYLVAVWGLSQGAVEIGPLFGVPQWLVRALVVGGIGMLPIVVILAWMFDIGRGGIVRDPQDLAAISDMETDIANMSTILGGDSAQGAVIVRWSDEGGENSSIFVEDFLLGRAEDCRVRFYDPLVSRRHARVYYENDGWRIEDLGSRNGTLVDEKQIERSVLPKQCELRVNEAGPALRFELVPSGAELRSALAAFPPGQMTAHIRNLSTGPR